MKTCRRKGWRKNTLVVVVAALLGTGCSQQQKDRDTKKIIASNTKQEIAFAGGTYTVKEGVVALGWNCPSQEQKDNVLTRVTNTYGVKEMVDQIQIAPVVLDSDFPLQQAVDSVFMNYATALGRVHDSVVSIEGRVENKERSELLKALADLHPKGINQQLADN